jgi:hypothetical protein
MEKLKGHWKSISLRDGLVKMKADELGRKDNLVSESRHADNPHS